MKMPGYFAISEQFIQRNAWQLPLWQIGNETSAITLSWLILIFLFQEFCEGTGERGSAPPALLLILSRLCSDFENATISYLVSRTCNIKVLSIEIYIRECLGVIRNTGSFEPRHEKTCLWGLQPGKTQTGLLRYRDYLQAWNFGYRN